MAQMAIRPGPWWWTPDDEEGSDRPTRFCFRDGSSRECQRVIEHSLTGKIEFTSWDIWEAFLIDVENPPEYPPEDEGGKPEPVEMEFGADGRPTEATIGAIDPVYRMNGAAAIVRRSTLSETDRKNSGSQSPSGKDEASATAESAG